MNKPHSLYIGLMSGTSLDGIDAVLAKIGPNGEASTQAAVSAPFSTKLRNALFELQSPGANELHREKQAGNALALAYAEAVSGLLKKANLQPSDTFSACLSCTAIYVLRKSSNFKYRWRCQSDAPTKKWGSHWL